MKKILKRGPTTSLRTSDLKLTIAWLYPDLMSTYGDRGNIIVLKNQCLWHDIDVDIKEITLETPLKLLSECDLVFMGGAQDRQQKIAGPDFVQNKGPAIKQMVEKDIPALFVCAAYQAVGHYYRPYQGEDIPGASIFDLTTVHPGDQAQRCIGNCVAETINPEELNGTTIIGFENHGGHTHLGPKLKPFARVLKGYGSNGKDGYEGAVYKNAIASYFHGPLLSKNPSIARWLITQALAVKYGSEIELEPLDETLEDKAREVILKRMKI
jgi:lipid II isoglutaminyl synthase (glutamine-hydrolysing)